MTSRLGGYLARNGVESRGAALAGGSRRWQASKVPMPGRGGVRARTEYGRGTSTRTAALRRPCLSAGASLGQRVAMCGCERLRGRWKPGRCGNGARAQTTVDRRQSDTRWSGAMAMATGTLGALEEMKMARGEDRWLPVPVAVVRYLGKLLRYLGFVQIHGGQRSCLVAIKRHRQGNITTGRMRGLACATADWPGGLTGAASPRSRTLGLSPRLLPRCH